MNLGLFNRVNLKVGRIKSGALHAQLTLLITVVAGKQQRKQRHVLGMDVAEFDGPGLRGGEQERAGEVRDRDEQRSDRGGGQAAGE